MIEWINQNKEWLFSGVGVSVFAGLVWIGQAVLKRHRSEVVTEVPTEVLQQEPPSTPSEPSLDIAGIIAEVYSLPPYQQNEAKRHYLGLKVKEEGVLFSADPADNMISFTISPYDESKGLHLIFCSVPETECPELKIAHKGWHMRVAGILKDFDRHAAYLEQVKVLTLRAEANNCVDSDKG